MALVCLANLVGIQTGPALDGDARPWRSETLSINRNKVAPAQFDPAGARPEPREGSDMVKCIRTTRAERESAVHPDDLARRRRLNGYAKLSPDEDEVVGHD